MSGHWGGHPVVIGGGQLVVTGGQSGASVPYITAIQGVWSRWGGRGRLWGG